MGFEMKQRERERPRNQKNEKEDRDRGRKWNCFGSLLADFILAAARETTDLSGWLCPKV